MEWKEHMSEETGSISKIVPTSSWWKAKQRPHRTTKKPMPVTMIALHVPDLVRNIFEQKKMAVTMWLSLELVVLVSELNSSRRNLIYLSMHVLTKDLLLQESCPRQIIVYCCSKQPMMWHKGRPRETVVSYMQVSMMLQAVYERSFAGQAIKCSQSWIRSFILDIKRMVLWCWRRTKMRYNYNIGLIASQPHLKHL